MGRRGQGECSVLVVTAGGVAGASPRHAELPRAPWAACAVGVQGPSRAPWCGADARVDVGRDHGRVLRGSGIIHGGAGVLPLVGFVIRGCRARTFGAGRGRGRVSGLSHVGIVADVCRGRGFIVRASASSLVGRVRHGSGPAFRAQCGRAVGARGWDVENRGVVFHPFCGRWQVVPVGPRGSGACGTVA